MRIQQFPNSGLTPTGLSPNTPQLCQTTCEWKYPNWCMHTCVYKNTQLTVDRNTSIPNICSTYLNWILSKYNQLCLDKKCPIWCRASTLTYSGDQTTPTCFSMNTPGYCGWNPHLMSMKMSGISLWHFLDFSRYNNQTIYMTLQVLFMIMDTV